MQKKNMFKNALVGYQAESSIACCYSSTVYNF